MNVNFSKTVTSATQFIDFCKKLDIQGNLSDSDLKAIYSCADKYKYAVVLFEDYQYHVEHLGVYELFYKYFDWGSLKDLGMEIGISQDSLDATLNDDENKDKIIKWACTGTNELLYEGNFMCRFSAPYDDFYNVCLNDLMDRLI